MQLPEINICNKKNAHVNTEDPKLTDEILTLQNQIVVIIIHIPTTTVFSLGKGCQ